jgi:flagellar basal-body rod protein FlgG
MVKGLYDAGQHLYSQMRSIQIVANNLANINTTGYKREVPFAEIIARAENQNNSQLTDFTSGTLVETENPLDLAITGRGLFMIKTDNGIELTNNGKFQISEEGFLVNGQGNKVMSKNGEVNINEEMISSKDSLVITKTGEIKIGDVFIDQLVVANVEDQSMLQRTADQNFIVINDEVQIADDTKFEIHQGYIEESNVNPILEMQAMIQINKDFEASQKIIGSLDQMMSKSQEIGRV